MLFSFMLALWLQMPDEQSPLQPDQSELAISGPRDPSLLPGIDIGGLTIETGATAMSAKTPPAYGFLRERSIPNSYTLRRVYYRYMSERSPFRLRFSGINVGQRDMNLDTELELSNRFRTRIGFAGFTRFWGRGGRTLLSEISPGRLVADPVLRFRLENASDDSLATILHDVLAQAPSVTISSQRERIFLDQDFKLTAHFRLGVSFLREIRGGNRPTSFGVFERTPTAIGDKFTMKGTELMEPTRYSTVEFGITADLTKPHWYAAMEYRRSQFHNRVPSLTYDNPFRITSAQATPAPGPAPLIGGATGAAQGRDNSNQHQASLPPDNRLDLLSAHFVAMLPRETKIAASSAWSRALQNVSFLPFTTNTAVVVNPGQHDPGFPLTSEKSLPKPSLDGNHQTMDNELIAKTRIHKVLDLSIHQSLNRQDNKTPPIVFPGVVADWDSIYQEVFLGTPDRPSVPYRTSPTSLHKDQTELEANIILSKHVRWKNAFSIQHETRTHRPVDRLSITEFKTGVSYLPKNGSLFDVRFDKWDRRPEHYQDVGGLEDTLIRMFDLSRAARIGGGFLTSTPLRHFLSVAVSGDFSRATFDPNGLGLRYQNGNQVSADVTFQNDSTSVAIGWAYDGGSAMQLAASGSCLPPCLRYRRQIRGRTNDIHINVDKSFGEDRLEFQFHYGLALDRQLIETANLDPVPVSSQLNALAYPAPSVKYQLGEFRGLLSLRLTRSLGIGAEGLMEPFKLSDFAVGGLTSWGADVASSQQNDASRFLFLAATPGSYMGRSVSAFLRFSF
jgi:hypothetical protein